MTRIVTLDSRQHRDLRVNPTHGAVFGDAERLVPVVTAEFADLALDMPILVVRDADTGAFHLAALMGFDDGENLFLDGSAWQAVHKPLDLQRRPFFAQVGEDGADMMIDLDSPRTGLRGEPLFDPDGAPSPFLDHMRSILAALMRGHTASQAFVEHLLDLNLLESVRLAIDFADRPRVLDGVFTLRREGVEALPDQAVLALHHSGELELIHLMLASFGHLPGLIRRKELRLLQQGSVATG